MVMNIFIIKHSAKQYISVLVYCSEIWQAHRQQYCRDVCQISSGTIIITANLRDFPTFVSKTSYRLVNNGPGHYHFGLWLINKSLWDMWECSSSECVNNFNHWAIWSTFFERLICFSATMRYISASSSTRVTTREWLPFIVTKYYIHVGWRRGHSVYRIHVIYAIYWNIRESSAGKSFGNTTTVIWRVVIGSIGPEVCQLSGAIILLKMNLLLLNLYMQIQILFYLYTKINCIKTPISVGLISSNR